jgi:two-component system, chemotaxis family, chemotaxis protein CheY
MNFIIVDDDNISLIIAKKMIKETLGDVDIKTFVSPGEALRYLQKDFNYTTDAPAVLFLDLNMPVISGWDFLDFFDQFNNDIKNVVRIYVVSSSVDPCDKNKALSLPYVKGFISKPLTSYFLIENFNSFHQ